MVRATQPSTITLACPTRCDEPKTQAASQTRCSLPELYLFISIRTCKYTIPRCHTKTKNTYLNRTRPPRPNPRPVQAGPILPRGCELCRPALGPSHGSSTQHAPQNRPTKTRPPQRRRPGQDTRPSSAAHGSKLRPDHRAAPAARVFGAAAGSRPTYIHTASLKNVTRAATPLPSLLTV